MTDKKNQKIDKKITPKQLAEKGLIIDGIEILPKISEEAQNQKRNKRELPYFKLFGRVYYQCSELVEFVNKHKVEAAS